MTRTLLSFLLAAMWTAASAVPLTKAAADSLYAKGHYAKAAEAYEQLIAAEPEQADLHYNLGNAYYKTDDIPRALLAYERALRLNPADGDTRANLALARTKITDKQADTSEMFFITWWKQAATALPATAYGLIAIAAFVLMLVALAVCVFRSSPRWALRSAALLLLVCAIANLLLLTQNQLLGRHDSAIVMDSSVSVKSSPDERSTDLFILHEGTKLRLLDTTMSQWLEVRLDEGKQGWIPRTAVEII